MDAGAVIIRLIADAKGVVTGVAQGTGAIRGFAANAESIGRKMTGVGKGMTKWVTLPILAAGAAAAKLSLDFEKTMTNVEALVGMNAQTVAKAKEQILSLAGEVGRAPVELGEAYYFLASSGLDAKDAMDALRASAKASAAGLGETKVIADAVSSALNAYGTANLDATRATDILLAAVREGKSEPEEFAGAIGRVIPMAEKMGVGFGEVAGMMAAMSLNGTNANEAVTQITAALSTAVKPTRQGVEALESIGMSYADLRKEIADKGLIETFDHLDEAFKGNVESLGAVFGNVRALRAIMTLTGPSMKKYQRIVEDVSKAQGDTARAAEIALSKPGAKIEKAWAKLQAQLIKAGDVLVPVLADVAESVGDLIEKFGSLPKGTQETIVKLAGLLAVVGPLAVGLGKMVTALASLKALAGGAAAVKALTAAAGGGLPGAVAGAGGLFPGTAGAAGAGAAAAGLSTTAIAAIAAATVAAVAASPFIVGKIVEATVGNTRYGAEVKKDAIITGGSKGGVAGAGRYDAYKAAQKRTQTVEQVIIDLMMRGGGDKKLNEAAEAIKALRSEAAKDIEFTIDPAKPLASLQSIQARLMGLGMSGEAAFDVLKSTFGKDVVAPFRKTLLGIPPVMDGVKNRVTAKHAQMAAALMKKIRMPAPDASSLLSTIQSVIARMQALGYSANQAADAVARAVSASGHLKSGVGAGGHLVRARGGVDYLTGATRYLAGEGGPEVAAFFPLNDPARSRALYSTLGAMLAEKLGSGSSAARTAPAAGEAGDGGTIVNVYLDSEPVAARVEVRQRQRERRSDRTLGLGAS